VTRPWQTLDGFDTTAGRIELRRRGAKDFLITFAGRVLMNSVASRSEIALAQIGCAALAGRAAPRVLIGGLGMGCTLRAALDALPDTATVLVAELHETIAGWCRGPLAELNRHAVEDPRVVLRIADVAAPIREAAEASTARLDAVLLDLYEGPQPAPQPDAHPHYGAAALSRTRAALCPGGVFAVWSEEPSPHFERKLARAGFAVRLERPGRAGRRHAVYLARAHADG
jgi:spermidine synthase